MNCEEVSKLLVAYLDNEVTLQERTQIRAHLDNCDMCYQELTTLGTLQSRVTEFLQFEAAQVAPPPQAWNRLQESLVMETRRPSSGFRAWFRHLASSIKRAKIFEGGMVMKKGLALTAIAALVITMIVVAFAPAAWAHVGQVLRAWFHIGIPSGEVITSRPAEFKPLFPTYLPAWFENTGTSIIITSDESEPFELAYQSADQFLVITQSRASGDRTLPAGQTITVSGQPAVLVTDLKGTFKYGVVIPEAAQAVESRIPPAKPYPRAIAYMDGRSLTWYVGDVKVEMLSNLAVEEMLKIAESLVPAAEGEPPFQPPSSRPSWGE